MTDGFLTSTQVLHAVALCGTVLSQSVISEHQ